MIGGDDHRVVTLCQLTEELCEDTVAEPAEGDAAESTLTVCQFTHHL